jgi:arylsulfatase A-like enzyme
MVLNALKLQYYILIFMLITCYSCKTKSTHDSKPNIIFILTDDQRWDALGAMGNPIIETPHIDELANTGILFQNAYVTTSICCVSRASILTGQYESRHKINDFRTSLTVEAFKGTYPSILKSEGYEIGFIGKYGIGDPDKQPKDLFDFWKGVNKHQPNYENINKKGDTIHYTDMIENDIITFLDREKNKPFCLSVSFKAPHAQDNDPRQFISKQSLKGYYENTIIPIPETAHPNYLDSLPGFLSSDENIARQRWKQRFSNPEQYQEMVKNYYRLISGVDLVVGNLMKKLKEENLDKNTVIIFMGDNGMYLGEHGLAGKWFGHEESIRVPLIIYDPRENGSRDVEKREDIALNIDVAPTILGLVGIDKPQTMQGVNLLSSNKKVNVKRDYFFYEHTFLGSPKLPKVEGVVGPKLKYLNYIEYNYEQLFDLENDPHEKYNLINNSKYTKKLDSLRSVYKNLKEIVK